MDEYNKIVEALCKLEEEISDQVLEIGANAINLTAKEFCDEMEHHS